MGWFSEDSEEAMAHETVSTFPNLYFTGDADQRLRQVTNSPHNASLTHELIAAAASYEAAKAYENHVAENGQPDSHAKAKELIAGFAGAFVDRTIETRGLDAIDAARAKHEVTAGEWLHKHILAGGAILWELYVPSIPNQDSTRGQLSCAQGPLKRPRYHELHLQELHNVKSALSINSARRSLRPFLHRSSSLQPALLRPSMGCSTGSWHESSHPQHLRSRSQVKTNAMLGRNLASSNQRSGYISRLGLIARHGSFREITQGAFQDFKQGAIQFQGRSRPKQLTTFLLRSRVLFASCTSNSSTSHIFNLIFWGTSAINQLDVPFRSDFESLDRVEAQKTYPKELFMAAEFVLVTFTHTFASAFKAQLCANALIVDRFPVIVLLFADKLRANFELIKILTGVIRALPHLRCRDSSLQATPHQLCHENHFLFSPMAATLGTFASVIQLVDTVLKAREYVQDFFTAPEEQKKLLIEMDDLRDGGAFDRIQKNDGEFHREPCPGEGRLSKFSKRVTWSMWNKKEATKYLEKFEQFKTLLNSWLLLDIWDMSGRNHSAVLSSVNNVNASVIGISDKISGQHRQMDSVERTQIIDWISPINFFLRLGGNAKAILSHADWPENTKMLSRLMASLFTKPFITRLGIKNKTLLLPFPSPGPILRPSKLSSSHLAEPAEFYLLKTPSGLQRQADISGVRQAGTGGWLLADPCFREWESGARRTLWCRGIHHLSAESETKKIGIACMYLSHKEAEDQTPVKLLTALWRQLILGKSVGALAKRLYQHHREKRTTPSLNKVFNVLRLVIAEYSTVYIVVDAIDEYPETQRSVLLEYLGNMGPAVNLMLTSRPHISPDTTLPNLSALEIRATQDDVRRFLLAKLHIVTLSTKSTIKAVREALKNLPKDLNHSYDDAMKRIESQNEEDRNIAHSALTWVVNAKRPLTVTELRVALAVEPDTRQLDDDNILDIELVLSVCAGLVILDEQSDVVRLVHYTIQEYFDSIQEQKFPDAQTDITRTLLTFLAFDDFKDLSWDDTDDLPPLVEYSQYSLMHAAGLPEAQLRGMLTEFLPEAIQWKNATRWKWRSPPWSFQDWPSSPSALWVAAAANLLELAMFLLEDAPSPQQSYAIETNVAAYYGHLQMVQMLVGHGADIHVSGGLYGQPLQAASCGGYSNLVSWLIEHGADVNAQGGIFGTAIQMASFGGYEDVVSLLLENGGDVNAQGGSLGGAIRAAGATYLGEENIVQSLLENNADVDAQSRYYGSAIRVASKEGHRNIVQLLLENSADAKVLGDKFGSAILAASFKGHENIVQLLLDNGADVNTQGGSLGSPIQAAAHEGHKNIVQLLIENGADMNTCGGAYGNAIQAASYGGHKDLAQLLLKNGANVNAQGGRYGSNIQAASAAGHESLVQLLLENGANVNTQGGRYGSALQAALSNGHHCIVQLLRENGAE
ncbi:hypothetical protein B0H19DRAFT_1239672 [Mycena capillaripes]|nr:hypothetical protein B0H19DRAFT_1239672 [Mycena capillaripes]